MKAEQLRESLKKSISKYNKTGHGYISDIESDAVINEILKDEHVKDLMRNK
jgi:hypothetical protein